MTRQSIYWYELIPRKSPNKSFSNNQSQIGSGLFSFDRSCVGNLILKQVPMHFPYLPDKTYAGNLQEQGACTLRFFKRGLSLLGLVFISMNVFKMLHGFLFI